MRMLSKNRLNGITSILLTKGSIYHILYNKINRNKHGFVDN